MRVDDLQAKERARVEGPQEPNPLGASTLSKRHYKVNENRLPFGEVHPSFRKGRNSRKYKSGFALNCDNSIISEGEEPVCHSFTKRDFTSLHLNAVSSQLEAYMDMAKTSFNCMSTTDLSNESEHREDVNISTVTEGDWDTSVEVDDRYDRREDVDTPLHERREIETDYQKDVSSDKYMVVEDGPTKGAVAEDLPFHQSRASVSCETMSNQIEEGLGKCYHLGKEMCRFQNVGVFENISQWVQSILGSESQQNKEVTKKVRFLEPSQPDIGEKKLGDKAADITASTAVRENCIQQACSNEPVKISAYDVHLPSKTKPKKRTKKYVFEIEEIHCQPHNPTAVNSAEIETRSPTQNNQVKRTKDNPKRLVRVSPKQRAWFGGRKRTLSTKKPPR